MRTCDAAVIMRVIASLVIAGLAAACHTVNPDQMVPVSSAPSAPMSDKTLAIGEVGGGVEANKLAFDAMDTVRVTSEQFRAALVKAIEARRLFRSVQSTGTGDYELSAEITSQQLRHAGFLTIASLLVVEYRLRAAASNAEVWRETISSGFVATGQPVVEGDPGATKKSLEGAVRLNLAEMMDKMLPHIVQK